MPVIAGGIAAYGVLKGSHADAPGSSNFQPSDYQTDPNAFQYGGHKGGADQAAGAATANQNTQNARQAGLDTASQSTFNVGQVGTQQEQDAMNAQGAARGDQQQALDMMRARAQGNDLVSNKVAAQQAGQLAAGQESLAAGARGPAALALAQQQRAANTAAGQTQIAGQAGVNAANEQLANEQAFGGMATTMRQGDLGAAAAGTSLAGTGYGASQGFANAGTNAGQLGLGYANLGNQIQTTQLGAQMQQQGIGAQQHTVGQQTGAATQEANAQNAWKPYELGLGAAGGIGSAFAAGAGGGAGAAGAAASDPQAKTDITPLGSQPQDPGYSDGMGPGGGAEAPQGEEHQSQSSAPAPRQSSDDGRQRALKDLPGVMGKTMPDLGTMSNPSADQLMAPLKMGPPSDPAAKEQIATLYHPQGMSPMASDAHGVAPLMDDPKHGYLHMNEEGMASYEGGHESGSEGRASLSGPVPRYSAPRTADNSTPRPAPAQRAERKMTPDEMNAWADRMLAEIQARQLGPVAVQPTLDRDAADQPQASDPAAKQEAYELGVQAGARDTHRMYHDPAYAKQLGFDPQTAAAKPDTMPRLIPREGEVETPRGLVTPEREKAPPPGVRARTEVLGATSDGAEPSTMQRLYDRVVAGPINSLVNHVRAEPGTPEHAARVERGLRVHGALMDARSAVDSVADPIARRVLPQRLQDDLLDEPQTSDPRGKVLGGVHDDEVADVLDETPAVSYRYKSSYFEPDAERPGERQLGFLTTDLKKTPLGAAVVEERPDGYEGYNEHRMIGLEFAGLRNVHERLRDLEAIIAEKHRGGRAHG